MREVREILQQRVLLLDGAMGTYYQPAPGLEWEQANLVDPEGILKVHREYLDAGAEALKTNTFGLTRMAAAGSPGWQELAKAGWELARQAAGDKAAVLVDLGPAPETEDLPAGKTYRQVADFFLDLGARDFLFETLSTDTGVAEAAAHIKARCPEAFILVSFAVLPDGYTREGVPCRVLAARMESCGMVDAVGLNCVSAPSAMESLLPELAGISLPLAVMPNAGYPVVTRSRVVYQGKPEYFAEQLCQMRQKGAVILGGCCGTTPAHIAALRRALENTPMPIAPEIPMESPASEKRMPDVPRDSFLEGLAEGRKVIAVELDSPKDADLTGYMESARRLQAAGVDALTIADCPIARARMDSSLVACKLRRELGMAAVPHMTCRDRNLNATKALLLGLYAEGVREILAITGDPIPSAERDEVKSVYQFHSRKLAQYILSLSGRELPGPMTVFGALNLNARNFEVELRRAQEKVTCGMTGFLTQPILSGQAVENLRQARGVLGPGVRLLAGILPVVSQRNALFMENEVNGIHLDPEIIQRYEGLDRAEGEKMGLELSLEMARAALPYADGFYLMTPFNRVGLMESLVKRLQTEVLANGE